MIEFDSRKESQVFVVETISSLRQVLRESLKGFGFEKIHIGKGYRELIDFMEVEPVDWVLGPVGIEQDINLLQLLNMVSQTPHLKSTKISTMLPTEEVDPYLLVKAFELGLYTFLERSSSQERIEKQIADQVTLERMLGHDFVRVSATYLRNYLRDAKMNASRLALEESLLSLYPGEARVLLDLADAQMAMGKLELGKGTVQQALLVDGRLRGLAKRICKAHNVTIGEEKQTAVNQKNALEIEVCVMIDPDTDLLQAAENTLSKLGCRRIEAFDNAEEAWEYLNVSPEPSLILMEWRIPVVSGPVLVQRIRNKGFRQTPIVVTSSQIDRREVPLIKEMGVDAVISKPYSEADLISAMIWTMQQNRLPSEEKSLEEKIHRLLLAKRVDEAKRLLNQFLSDPRIRPCKKTQIKATFAYHLGDFNIAEKLSIRAIRDGGDRLLLLNQLGKIYLHLKRYQESLRCFAEAHRLCPYNIERLVNIALADMSTGGTQSAEKALNMAKKLDKDDPISHEAIAQKAILDVDPEKARVALEKLDSASRVISLINSRAIALVHEGRFEEAIKLYNTTEMAMSSTNIRDRCAVIYNQALAFARYGDYSRCLAAVARLEKIGGTNDTSLDKKWKSLKHKVANCLETGEKLDFEQQERSTEVYTKSDTPASFLDTGDETLNLDDVAIGKGELCCFLVFFSQESIPQEIEELSEPLPRFSRRGAIEFSHQTNKRRVVFD